MYRKLTKNDLLQFMPSVPCTAKGYTAVDGDIIYGVGGVYYEQGNVFAFTHFRPDMPRKDRIRAGRLLVDFFKTISAPIWALPGPFETAERTLKHFGFEPVPHSNFYIWRRSA